MLVISAVFWAWTVICWFTELRPEPFLGIGILSISPAIPLLLAVAATITGFVLWWRKNSKNRDNSIPGLLRKHKVEIVIVFAIILVHVTLEVPAIFMHRGANDWDSALWGLAGYHIADGARPIFGYGYSQGVGEGQHYNGTIIPHITAVMHVTFGPSPVYLRLVETIFFVGFLIAFYVLLKRFLEPRAAQVALVLMALPSASVFKLIRHTEYSLLALIGTIVLLLALRIADSEKPGWQLYFGFGLTVGIGFYVIPQIIFFAITGLLIIFLRHRLFFIKPEFWTVPAGFILGASPVFIDAWYSQGLSFKFLASSSIGLAELIPHTFAGVLESFRLAAWYLGGTYAVSPTAGEDVLPVLLTSGLWLVLLVAFVFVRWSEILDVIRGKKTADIEAFLLLALVTIAIFSVSSYSAHPAPYRYLFPLALCIPPILAVVLEPLFKLDRRVYSLVVVILVVFFVYTLMYQDLVNTVRQESYFSELEGWLRSENVDRIYGSFAVVYNLSFSTKEEIIGSTAYHWSYDAYKPYTQAVADSPNSAYFFLPQENDAAIELVKRLGTNNISFSVKRNHLGVLVSKLNPHVPVETVRNLSAGMP